MFGAQVFLERRVPLSSGGGADFLVLEMGLPPTEEGTWVVLRESRKYADRTPVLTACFEHIANYLSVELFVMRRLARPARYFHCRYELKAAGEVSWALREVTMANGPVGMRLANWTYVDEPTRAKISESLNLSESPEKLT